VITFQDVGVTVATPTGPRQLLRHLTVELSQQRVVVLGANGSGKSTLLRLINGLVTPTSGQVEVNQLSPFGRQAAAVRRQVGFVFTDPLSQLLMPTAVEDIELSLRHLVSDRAERHQQALALMDQWGLGRLAQSSVYDLSGGERQLVALLSVLAVRPRVIVADEPTTLLDLRNSRLLHERLAGLDQQIIVATHDLTWAETFDRALVIDDGQLVFDGQPAAAIDHYRHLAAGEPNRTVTEATHQSLDPDSASPDAVADGPDRWPT
jgi:biotin transport system ATP-binding protein